MQGTRHGVLNNRLPIRRPRRPYTRLRPGGSSGNGKESMRRTQTRSHRSHQHPHGGWQTARRAMAGRDQVDAYPRWNQVAVATVRTDSVGLVLEAWWMVGWWCVMASWPASSSPEVASATRPRQLPYAKWLPGAAGLALTGLNYYGLHRLF
jgi:hypothetical protein